MQINRFCFVSKKSLIIYNYNNYTVCVRKQVTEKSYYSIL